MSIRLNLTRRLLHLSPNVFASERRLRRTLWLPRRDAPVPWWLRRRCAVERLDGLGCPVLRLRPKRPSGVHIVYLHGGSFVFPVLAMHWWIIAALMDRTRAVVTVPSYALAPESTLDDSIGALDATVQQALADPDAHKVILAGDSAGGNLSIVQAMRCRNHPGAQPAALILFSPAVDLALDDPASAELERVDPILARPGVRATGRWWAGERSLADPMISPLHGDLHELPPMTVLQGGCDILQPDVEKFITKARAAGNDIAHEAVPNGFHVYVAARHSPEAQTSFDLAAQRIAAA